MHHLPVMIGISPQAIRMVQNYSCSEFFKPWMMDAKVLLLGGVERAKSDFFQHGFTRGLPLFMDFKTHHTKNCYYSIFDMPNQERFKTITQAYFQSAAVVMFFENDKGLFNTWMEENPCQQKKLQLYSLDLASDGLKLVDTHQASHPLDLTSSEVSVSKFL